MRVVTIGPSSPTFINFVLVHSSTRFVSLSTFRGRTAASWLSPEPQSAKSACWGCASASAPSASHRARRQRGSGQSASFNSSNTIDPAILELRRATLQGSDPKPIATLAPRACQRRDLALRGRLLSTLREKFDVQVREWHLAVAGRDAVALF